MDNIVIVTSLVLTYTDKTTCHTIAFVKDLLAYYLKSFFSYKHGGVDGKTARVSEPDCEYYPVRF